MAEEYRSRRIRDSFTMKSANRRTLSASEAAADSLAANDRNLSIVAVANCSAVWPMTACLEIGVNADIEGRDESLSREPDADRV